MTSGILDISEKGRRGKLEKDEMSYLYPKALDGFLMIVDNVGDMIFVSENVSKYLGVTQVSDAAARTQQGS